MLERFANHLITEQKLIWGQSDDGSVSERVLLLQLRRWNFILIDSYLASFVMQTDASKRCLPSGSEAERGTSEWEVEDVMKDVLWMGQLACHGAQLNNHSLPCFAVALRVSETRRL